MNFGPLPIVIPSIQQVLLHCRILQETDSFSRPLLTAFLFILLQPIIARCRFAADTFLFLTETSATMRTWISGKNILFPIRFFFFIYVPFFSRGYSVNIVRKRLTINRIIELFNSIVTF